MNNTGCGVDIAVRRADQLERRLMDEISQGGICDVLDLGSGAGGAAARLASLGAHVTAVDRHDFNDAILRYNFENITFVQKDLSVYIHELTFEQYDFVLCNRVLHYVPYYDAMTVLTSLASHIKQKLYLSLSGLDSDIGNVYPDRDKDVQHRFTHLTAIGQKTFNISEPIVLYTKEEAINLVESVDLHIEEVLESAFKNICIVACP